MEFKYNDKVNVIGFNARKYPKGVYVKDVIEYKNVVLYYVNRHKYFNLFPLGEWIKEDLLYKLEE